MPIYDHDGSARTEIGKLYDYNGSAAAQIDKVYDYDGSANHLIYQSAVPFSVGSISATAKSNYSGHKGTASANSSSFTLNGHRTLSCTLTRSLGGNYRRDYAPGYTAYFYLRNSAGSVIRNWSGGGTSTAYPSFNVTGLVGSYYVQVYCECQTANINHENGSSQTANYTVTASGISVSV